MTKKIIKFILKSVKLIIPSTIAGFVATFHHLENLDRTEVIVDMKYKGKDKNIYKSVNEALKNAPNDLSKYLIFIKKGTYYEQVIVERPNVEFIGEDKDKTKITYDLAQGSLDNNNIPIGKENTPSVTIKAKDFKAKNIIFENGFDYISNNKKRNNDLTKIKDEQAIALKTDKGSDRTYFENCKFIGYQDTLFVDNNRHYFKNCSIIGNIDFIYGKGCSVFYKCDIISRNCNKIDNNGYITAASTNIKDFGFLFLNCSLKKENSKLIDKTVFLGRPWHPTKEYKDGNKLADPSAVGNVVFVNCFMDSHIKDDGWDKMHGRDINGRLIWFYPKDSRFYEFENFGPGALVSEKRGQLTNEKLSKYCKTNFLGDWDVD